MSIMLYCSKANWLHILFGVFIILILNFVINYLYVNTKLLSSTAKRRTVCVEYLNDSSTVFKDSNGTNEGITQALLHSTFTNQTNGSRECRYEYPASSEGVTITPDKRIISLYSLEKKYEKVINFGGSFTPTNCTPKFHVAIIVPFRDRYAHMSIFLNNIHSFLIEQHIQYRIFIIEQTIGKKFNRASLMNIGYIEALKLFNFDCFIFHDVDLLPLDRRNMYTCSDQPRHMSVAIDMLGFKLPYSSLFGGVSAMSREHFFKVNGFSNSFWGWGGEDDDMSNRLKHAHLFISRYPINIARYIMLNHQKEKANPQRYQNLASGVNKFEMDGLNSVKYNVCRMKMYRLFTWLLTELTLIDQR